MKGERLGRAEQYGELLARCPALAAAWEPPGAGSGPEAPALCGVMAPALCEFVRWIMVTAIRRGKERIYFLGRDGYFPYRAAQIFRDRFGLALDCRYLSVSRAAVRRPLFHLDHTQALAYLCRGGIDVTPERILTRAGLDANERAAVWNTLALPYGREAVLTRSGIRAVYGALASCARFWAAVDAHSRPLLPALTAYLRQEGLTEPTADLIVDCGWVGSMQAALTAACIQAGRRRPLEGCYFGLYELPPNVRPADYHAFFFYPQGPLKNKIGFNNNVLEAVFTAPHGMTVGYDGAGGVIRPIYEHLPRHNYRAVRHAQELLIPAVHRCARGLGCGPFFTLPFGPARGTLCALLRTFMHTPTPGEAEWFGRLPFSDDVLGDEGRELAPVLSRQMLRAALPLPGIPPGGGCIRGPVSPWYEGSAVRSLPDPGPLLRRYAAGQAVRFWIKGRFAGPLPHRPVKMDLPEKERSPDHG